MSSDPFQPGGNGVALATSTTSNSMAVPTATAIVVTNRSPSSAWVTWSNSSGLVAAFPSPGDPIGSFGMELEPMMQISISVGYANAYVAAVLLNGTGMLTVVPGTGL